MMRLVYPLLVLLAGIERGRIIAQAVVVAW
jgi:hypothetical protein